MANRGRWNSKVHRVKGHMLTCAVAEASTCSSAHNHNVQLCLLGFSGASPRVPPTSPLKLQTSQSGFALPVRLHVRKWKTNSGLAGVMCLRSALELRGREIHLHLPQNRYLGYPKNAIVSKKDCILGHPQTNQSLKQGTTKKTRSPVWSWPNPETEEVNPKQRQPGVDKWPELKAGIDAKRPRQIHCKFHKRATP